MVFDRVFFIPLITGYLCLNLNVAYYLTDPKPKFDKPASYSFIQSSGDWNEKGLVNYVDQY